jgi:hypothetical protein
MARRFRDDLFIGREALSALNSCARRASARGDAQPLGCMFSSALDHEPAALGHLFGVKTPAAVLVLGIVERVIAYAMGLEETERGEVLAAGRTSVEWPVLEAGVAHAAHPQASERLSAAK